MEIGKLPNDLLNKLVLEPIKRYGVKRDEVMTLPSIGEDCAAIRAGEDIIMLSTDPITGAAENIGVLAVNINANDIASSGGEVIGLMVTVLLPPSITGSDITSVVENLYKSAEKAGVAVLGGHTEITDAVTRPVISCTAIGKGKRFISSGGAKVGDDVIMTKYAAIEGSSIIYNDNKDYWENKLTAEEKQQCKSLSTMLSVVKDGALAAANGANAMHDVTEGGIFGACYEIAQCAGLGIEVYTDKIPMLPVTKKLCDICGINPYRLISSGSMLIAAPNGKALADKLTDSGINAAVIGKIRQGGYKVVMPNGERELEPPTADELYKVVL